MSQHVVPVRTYFGVFVALMLLLLLTVGVAVIEHPALGLPIALAIAGAKASLILLYFMHLRWDSRTVRLASMAGFLWLALLMSLSLSDVLTRCAPAAFERQTVPAADAP